MLHLLYGGGRATSLDEFNTIRVLPTEKYFAMIRQTLYVSGQAYVRVTGNSMWPMLRHLRDGVVISSRERVHVGDIVLFDRLNGHYALHRVIKKGRNGFTMAGDNQCHMEEALPYDQIMGVAVSIDRNGHKISRNNYFVKSYAIVVTAFTFPRIYLWKLVQKLGKPFRDKHPTG